MGISSNPTNTNLAQANKFLLSFDRLPALTYFCTAAPIPGVSVGTAKQTNPFADAPIPGDKMEYEDLEITFLVDEALLSWTSILDWIRGYAFPENFDQYKNLPLQQKLQVSADTKSQYSDAMLTVYSNKNNPVLQIAFTDLFPVSLSGVEFSTQQSAENILTARATFKYTNFSYKRF